MVTSRPVSQEYIDAQNAAAASSGKVKFYSVATLPAIASTTGAGGIYFVGGGTSGELYKGTTRFGAARVTTVANESARNNITGMIRGDIAICTVGGTFVYDGTNWQPIGPDTSALQTSWRADISTWTAGLVAGGTGSIVTGITQAADGKVTATAIKFPEITSPEDGHVSLAGTDVEISGWTDLVSAKDDLVSRVEALETWEGSVTGSTVVAGTKLTAETGTFKNLTVAETATFNAITVTASTLTIADEAQATFGNLTISAIADREALAKIAAIAEATSEASDDGVKVTAVTQSGSIKSIAVAVDGATTASEFTSTSTKVATAKGVAAYVDETLKDINGAMRFYGTTEAGAAGDIAAENITMATGLTEALQAGDVIVSTENGKEFIYDGSDWRELGDDTLVGALVTYTGYDTTLTTTATTLAGAVNELDAEIKAMDYSTPSDDNASIVVTVTQENGAITDVAADLVWLDKDGKAISATA